MKRIIAVLMTSAGLVLAAPASAHHPVLDENAFNLVLNEQQPPPPPMTAKQKRKWNSIVMAANRRSLRAQAAHFTYTYTVMWNNLMDTNLDRACGWGANQYCPSDDPNQRPRAPFIGWVGEHSLDTEFIWSQYTYCLPGCDVWDYCDARVHVTDHNDGGRVNVNYVGTWYVKESSCVIPTWVVP